MNFSDEQLALKSLQYRRRTLEIIKYAGAGHTGGSLSCVDILNVLYNRILRVSPATFTDPGGASPLRIASTCRTVSKAWYSIAGLVRPPICGVAKTCSIASNG